MGTLRVVARLGSNVHLNKCFFWGNPILHYRPPSTVYSKRLLICSSGRGLPSTSTYG
jgi:hypothetical protein